tara:strand:+ start:1702 stop:1998 length:297 start_codon:yes stop_codon:yes gene_type:complete
MNVDELYVMTPAMFYNAQEGLFDQWQMQTEKDWEIARWMCAVIINPHVKKNMKPKDITQFPWEKSKTRKTQKEVKKLQNEAELYKKIVEKEIKENGKK